MTDLELVDRAAAGDEDAFAEIVRRYRGLVMKEIRKKAIPPRDVDDVYNETLLLLWSRLSQLSRDMRNWNRSTLYLSVSWTVQKAIYRFRERQGSVQPGKSRIGGFWRIPAAQQLGDQPIACNVTHDHVDNKDAAEFFLGYVTEEDRSILMRRMSGEQLKAIEESDGAGEAHARRRIDAAIAEMQHVAHSPPGPLGIMVLPSGTIRRKGRPGKTYARPGSDLLAMILAALGDSQCRDEVESWSAEKASQRRYRANTNLREIGLELLTKGWGFRDVSGDVVYLAKDPPEPSFGPRVIHSHSGFGFIIREKNSQNSYSPNRGK